MHARGNGFAQRVIRRLDAFDAAVAAWMERFGHGLHRVGLGGMFVWFGALKLAGQPTATSILAHTIYLGPPETMVRVLGAWEVLIGVCLLWAPLVRIAIPLLLVRLVGTAAALALRTDVCFAGAAWVPTPEGQYLVKDLLLLGAALVIGGTVRRRPPA